MARRGAEKQTASQARLDEAAERPLLQAVGDESRAGRAGDPTLGLADIDLSTDLAHIGASGS